MHSESVSRKFSFERCALLLRNRALEDLPSVSVGFGILVALNALSLAFGRPPILNMGGASTTWPVFVAIGGILLASHAFERMQNGRSGPDWLLLPATATEKYLSALFMYLIAYPILASFAAWGLSAALAGVGALLGTGGGEIWNPLDSLTPTAASTYLSFAIVAIAGSARFRKIAIGKTAAAGIAWVAVLMLLFGTLLNLVSPELRQVLKSAGDSAGKLADGTEGKTILYLNNFPLEEAKAAGLRLIWTLFHWGSIAFAAIYGFVLVAEKEAKDEVQ